MIDNASYDQYLDETQKSVWQKLRVEHPLADENRARNFILLTTYYRRNLHIFARDYLKLNLHLYQQFMLYLMGVFPFIVIIAARTSAKTFTVAVYCVCRCILYPGTQINISSGTRGQGLVLIKKKIVGELLPRSDALFREVERYSITEANPEVRFKNLSGIFVTTLLPTSRGNRATVNIAEEAREINKKLFDEVIDPFLFVRQVPYMQLPEYSGMPSLTEEPVTIMISSSIEEDHWLYAECVRANKDMLAGGASCVLCLDYAITLYHNLKTRAQMQKAINRVDPITADLEYRSFTRKNSRSKFFSVETLRRAQVVKRAFYPRRNVDVKNGIKNPYMIPKKSGEIRIVACDCAFIDRAGNDNSSFHCLRVFPEDTRRDDGGIETTFRIQDVFIETKKGYPAAKQGVRIRQLYEDFNADYIVLDLKNAGISVYDELSKVLYDDERGVEYDPLWAINEDAIGRNRLKPPGAKTVIWCMQGSSRLNSDIAVNLRSLVDAGKLELLISQEDAPAEIVKFASEYAENGDDETTLFFEKPYIETAFTIAEIRELEFEKTEKFGLWVPRERQGNTKDRYSALSYGCAFATDLIRDVSARGSSSADDYCVVKTAQKKRGKEF